MHFFALMVVLLFSQRDPFLTDERLYPISSDELGDCFESGAMMVQID
jgi:hypothetical protein